MRKLWILCLSLIATVCLLSACQFDFGTDGLAFCPLDDGTYAVEVGEAKYLSEVLIPATYKGKTVSTIGKSAFANCKNLKSITIPNSVTTIGERAFYNCTSLTSVTIPDSVTTIGDYAFYNCTGLTSVTIGDGVTSISDDAFYNCTDLTSVTIPNSVTEIGDRAFYECTSLTSIKYRGTRKQWNAISKGSDWNFNTGNFTITYNYTGEE